MSRVEEQIAMKRHTVLLVAVSSVLACAEHAPAQNGPSGAEENELARAYCDNYAEAILRVDWQRNIPNSSPECQELLLWRRKVVLLGAASIPHLCRLSRHENARVRRWTVDAIPFIDADAQSAVGHLIVALRDPDESVRFEAAEAFGRIGPCAVEAVPALILAMRDTDAFVRIYSAKALGKIGATTPRVVPALAAALTDENHEVRWRAAESLGRMGPKATVAIPALERLLNDRDGDVRNAALEAVANLRNASEAGKIALKVIESTIEAPGAQRRCRGTFVVKNFGPAFQTPPNVAGPSYGAFIYDGHGKLLFRNYGGWGPGMKADGTIRLSWNTGSNHLGGTSEPPFLVPAPGRYRLEIVLYTGLKRDRVLDVSSKWFEVPGPSEPGEPPPSRDEPSARPVGLPDDRAMGVLETFLGALAGRDFKTAYGLVAPSSKKHGDPIAYRASLNYKSFLKELAPHVEDGTTPSGSLRKFTGYALGRRRWESPERFRVFVTFQGGDRDEVLIVRENDRWYVADPIHIIR